MNILLKNENVFYCEYNVNNPSIEEYVIINPLESLISI